MAKKNNKFAFVGKRVSKHNASKKNHFHNHNLSRGELNTSQTLGIWQNPRQYRIQKKLIEFENLPEYTGEEVQNAGE